MIGFEPAHFQEESLCEPCRVRSVLERFPADFERAFVILVSRTNKFAREFGRQNFSRLDLFRTEANGTDRRSKTFTFNRFVEIQPGSVLSRGNGKTRLVVVADSQLSLAIGKNGQNVRLAARLTGWKIDIISATEYEKEKAERDKEIKAALAEEVEAQRQQEEARQQEKAQQEAEG